MERIHEHVVVTTSQCALSTAKTASADSTTSPATPRATALQFTVINTGFDVVTFSADFRASASIQLRFPRGAPYDTTSSSSNENDKSLLHFDCRVCPFERKTLVHVLKVAGKRAFVRVQFTFQSATSSAVHEIEQAQQHDGHDVLQAIKRAQSKYYANSSSLPVHALGNTPQSVTRRCCDDINRFFRANAHDDDARFVDVSFPPKRISLIGIQDNGGGDDSSEALYALCSWKHLHDVMDDGTSWSLLTKDKPHTQLQSPPQSPQGKFHNLPRLTNLKSPLPGQDALICALAFLALEKTKWASLWFANQLLTDSIQTIGAITVKICDRGMQWKQIVVDLYLPGFPIGAGLMTISAPSSGEMYGSLVQKAYAKLKGSYMAIIKIPTITILRELTSLPWVNIYSFSREQQDEQSGNIHRATFQKLICRRYRSRHRRSQNKSQNSSAQATFVVSFGKIGDHHCAFPVLFGNQQDGITFQDVDSRVRKALDSAAKQIETGNNGGLPEDEKLVVACNWGDFFQLEPRAWMVFANHSESRRQRVKFVNTGHDAENSSRMRTTCVQFAFSVAEMTSLVIATQLEGGGKRQQSHHQLALDVAEHDFSLTRIPTEVSNEGLASGTELQLVVALGAGEYILSVNIETMEPPVYEDVETNEFLTVKDSERNLQLLFDCIDQDMDGAISMEELQAFLQVHEDHEPLLHNNNDMAGSRRLVAVFMDQFGSQGDSVRDSKELLVDDLRDVYRFLAASALITDQDPASNRSESETQRYEELIWNDLNFVLLPPMPVENDDLPLLQFELSDGERAGRRSIQADDIEELRCCVHSDMPLINFVRLPTPSL